MVDETTVIEEEPETDVDEGEEPDEDVDEEDDVTLPGATNDEIPADAF